MKLGELLKRVRFESYEGSQELDLKSVSYDSRTVQDGALYVAITGLRTDGRRFAKEASASGAAAIASESIEDLPDFKARIKINDARKFLAEASACFTGYPDREMTIIGVTGTNGKTTITYLLESILRAGSRKTGVIGTTGFFNGESWEKLSHTTPESADLWNILKGMKDKGCDTVAMEISSHSLELDRVWGLDVDIAVFTNLTQDHLDFHKDMNSYKAAKFKLFDNIKKEGISIVNADDQTGLELIERLNGKRVVSYSTSGRGADLWVELEYSTIKGSAAVIHYRGLALPCFLGLPGGHNISNLAAASGAALTLGIEPETLKIGVEALKCVPGRFEEVENDKGFFIFVDYAHTPDALERLIKSARELAPRRVITLFGCGGDRDKGKRPMMGRIASGLSDYVFVTSDNPRTENPDEIIREILAGVDGNNNTVIVDRREAIHAAVRFLEKDDVLLVAGKGHEDYQILGTEKIHFDDKEVAKEAVDALP
ncbi:UDP-N-acetylmuramoyl-L-alanyl-D-glutamate--2,6-diaminopimelate ligase [bacterium]|nr:UDP-N-acetylmuramoyl-L-alanyl-D-glutamate--2,6-diaminopimelate ligase [bacterium]